MKMAALLKGINVGGNKRVPMAELCSLAEKVGLTQVRHYINSGNLVFDAGKLKRDSVAKLLEAAIEKHFGFHVDVIVRTATQWKKYISDRPFANAANDRPNGLHLGLSRLPSHPDLLATLESRATQGEKIKRIGDAIWIDFVKGVGKSKLTPAFLEKAAGSSVTLRNWNTVLKIEEMLTE